MSRDTSFYYSFLVLPARKRTAIIAVWDFCRAVDDAVDEVVPEDEWKGGLTAGGARAARELAGWRGELEARLWRDAADAAGHGAAAVRPRVPPAARAVRGADRRRRNGSVITIAIRRSTRWRSTAVAWRRRSADLRRDLRLPRSARARLRRRLSGMALQITNIIRDVADDLRRGRIYLPPEDLAALRRDRRRSRAPAW